LLDKKKTGEVVEELPATSYKQSHQAVFRHGTRFVNPHFARLSHPQTAVWRILSVKCVGLFLFSFTGGLFVACSPCFPWASPLHKLTWLPTAEYKAIANEAAREYCDPFSHMITHIIVPLLFPWLTLLAVSLMERRRPKRTRWANDVKEIIPQVIPLSVPLTGTRQQEFLMSTFVRARVCVRVCVWDCGLSVVVWICLHPTIIFVPFRPCQTVFRPSPHSLH
jgi:hypothetical protein